MSKTSSTSKNKYNAKAYDQLPIRVPKGQKDVIAGYAKEKGYPSLNAYVTKLINADMNSSD